MATFAAILGLLVELELDDIAATSKTLPEFAVLWQQLIAGAA
jgi:3-phosphoshikimate 1-carboxyvinyltransferase